MIWLHQLSWLSCFCMLSLWAPSVAIMLTELRFRFTQIHLEYKMCACTYANNFFFTLQIYILYQRLIVRAYLYVGIRVNQKQPTLSFIWKHSTFRTPFTQNSFGRSCLLWLHECACWSLYFDLIWVCCTCVNVCKKLTCKLYSNWVRLCTLLTTYFEDKISNYKNIEFWKT